MKLQEINLDDASYDDLMKEVMSIISTEFPQWKDYPSEPGIILTELFAFLAECAIYQINRVPLESFINFGKLLGIITKDSYDSESKQKTVEMSNGSKVILPVDDRVTAIRRLSQKVQELLKKKNRLVTLGDYENFVVGLEFEGEKVVRAKADLVKDISDNPQKKPEYIRIIPVTWKKATSDTNSGYHEPSEGFYSDILGKLKSASLICTSFSLSKLQYTTLDLNITLAYVKERFVNIGVIAKNIPKIIENFLSPVSGGSNGAGWELNQPIYSSDLLKLVSDIDGVDYIESITYRVGKGAETGTVETTYNAIGESILLEPETCVFKLGKVNVFWADE